MATLAADKNKAKGEQNSKHADIIVVSIKKLLAIKALISSRGSENYGVQRDETDSTDSGKVCRLEAISVIDQREFHMSQDYDPGDYNRGGMIAFMFSMVVTMVFFVYVGFVHKGVDLKEIPQTDKVEKEQAQPEAEAPEEKAKEEKAEQAWNSTPTSIHHGQKVFFSRCQSCHGADGRGKGPQSRGLKVPPRDLVRGNWLRGGDSVSLYSTITNGLGLGSPMMSYRFLSVSDRWALGHYIRSITENRVEDDQRKLLRFSSKTVDN